jgi:LmbE family N-acetylglucosaminyl deacetylase
VLGLPIAPPTDRPLRVLALGAHSDDIEIGCGGTLLRLIQELPGTEIFWSVVGADQERTEEAGSSARDLMAGAAELELAVGAFPDGRFPFVGAEVKTWVHELGARVRPDIVITHHRDDLHQDHRFLAELALQAFRDHLILGFEIPKFDGDLGAPNVFVHLDEQTCARKIGALQRHFPSQADKPWFHEETFRGLMRLRGVESRSPSGYAEAFYCRKLVLMPSLAANDGGDGG